MTESAYAHHTTLPATSRPARRADAGTARLSQRGIDGPLARTSWIMAGLLSPLRHAQEVYLPGPTARAVVMWAAGSLPPGKQAGMVIRKLPAAAFTPEQSR